MKQFYKKIIVLFIILIPITSKAQLIMSDNSDWFRYCYLEIENYYTKNRNGIMNLPKFRTLNELLKYFKIKNYSSGWKSSSSNQNCYIKTEYSKVGIKDGRSVSNIYRHNCVIKDPYSNVLGDDNLFMSNDKYYIVLFVEPYEKIYSKSVIVAVVLKTDSSKSNFYGEWDAFFFY